MAEILHAPTITGWEACGSFESERSQTTVQIIALTIIASRIHRELLTNSTESSWVTPLAYRRNELACKPDL